MVQTNLAQAVEAADAASTYDANVKYLLADRQILARILKYAVSEFRHMEIEEIMPGIGPEIEIGERPVDAGLSNLGRIKEGNTEDNVPGEGKIYYDIRFTAYQKQKEMKFLINIEAQKSSDTAKLGYHLENRIIFYLSRMVSAQKQTEFFHSDYDNLKKVRSIWICMDGNRTDGDSIEEISLERKTVFGNRQSTSDIDLIKGIVIHIRNGRNYKTSQNKLISMLEGLLSQIEPEEKKRILSEEYGLVMTTALEGRIQTMCNLSENIIELGMEKGLEKGIEKGIEKGMREGIQKERMDAIERMVKAGASKEQILSYGYTEEEYRKSQESLLFNH